MKVLANSLKGATRLKDSQGMSKNLSKVLELGKSYRFFVPLTVDEHGEKDILVAAMPGRKLNYEKLNRSFINLSDFEVSETGRVTDKTGLAPYARISKILHDAEYAAEKARADRDAKQTAEQMGKDIDIVALKQAHRDLELKYYGDKDAKPNAIYAEMSPMISGVVIETATEVLVVPLNTNNEPEWGKATLASMSLSNKKATQLLTILANPDYLYDATKNYLEVAFTYAGTDKKSAGMNAVFNGVSKDVSLATKFNESWEANKDILNRLATTSEIIASRNMTMSSNTTTKEVVELFNKYIAKHELILAYIDYEDDMVKSAAKDMVELKIAANAPRVQAKLIELVESQNTTEAEDEEDINAGIIGVGDVASIADLQARVGGDLDSVVGDSSIEEL